MPRPKGSPNKLTSEIKERLSQVIMDAMSSIDIDSMTQNERLKLIQIGLTYVVPKLKTIPKKLLFRTTIFTECFEMVSLLTFKTFSLIKVS